MTVELLYLSGCPHHEEAADLVRNVLEAEGLNADFIEILISNHDEAKAHGFPGSPTLRVNGQDVEKIPVDPLHVGLACRTYFDGGKHKGVPPRTWLEHAIRAARTVEENQP